MYTWIKNFFTLLGAVVALAAVGFGAFGLYTSREQPAHTHDVQQITAVKNIVPVVIIGSGPAGLSAALYTARSALYTVVFEGKTPGGQLTGTSYVENWPGTGKQLGSELIDTTRKQAQRFGALMVNDTIKEVDFSQWPFKIKTEEGHELAAMTVIIATGAQPKLLNDARSVPGEKEYWGHGVTTCAICDAAFYKGKKVVVIGGGDSAVEEATLLTSYADEVTVIVRGSSMRAAPAMQARLKESPKIKILYNTEIEEITGDGSKVSGVKLINTKDKKQFDMVIDGVFLAIGHRPNTELFKKFIEIAPDGYIIMNTARDSILSSIWKRLMGTDATNATSQETSIPGIFAAGDVADPYYRQAGVAAGDGIKAALNAIKYLGDIGYNEAFAHKIEKNFYEPNPEAALHALEKLKTNEDFVRRAKEHQFMVIEVGAETCSSCKALLPVVQSVAARMEDKAFFAQIDLGDEPAELVKRFAIEGIPVLLVIKDGKLLARYDQHLFSKRELAAVLHQLFEE